MNKSGPKLAVFIIEMGSTTSSGGRSRTEKIMLRKIEPKSFGIAIAKVEPTKKWLLPSDAVVAAVAGGRQVYMG